MDINEYGFLGKDIKHYEENLIKKYEEVFDFIEEINHFSNIKKFNFDIKNDDLQGGTIIGLFTKSLTTFQAIYILFKHCLCNNAENLCRILFEEMVNIAYCSLGVNEAKRYLSLESIDRLKKINKIIDNKIFFSEEETNKAFKGKSLIDKKNEEIDHLQKLNIKDLFNKKSKPIGISLEERIKEINSLVISNYYISFYSIVSEGVHSSPNVLNRYLIFHENGLVQEIHWGPEAENCEIYTLIAAIHFMIINIEYIHKYFKYPEKDIISKNKEKLKILGTKYNYFN